MKNIKVGVISANSLNSWVFDEIHQGIDLDYTEYRNELQVKLDSNEISEEEFERELEFYDSDNSTILFGDLDLIDNEGTVVAYSLPLEYFKKEGEE